MNDLTSMQRAGLPALTRNHFRRLRQYYRSAGWPCRDNVEIDLLELGLVRRELSTAGNHGLEAIVVTDAGIAMLARFLEANRRMHAEHDKLVDRVARYLLAQKRLVFRGIGMRTHVDDAWALSRPDVFSVRHVTSSHRLHPAVHEIKVTRADLLCDLKKESKRRGYQSYSQSFYYVIAEGHRGARRNSAGLRLDRRLTHPPEGIAPRTAQACDTHHGAVDRAGTLGRRVRRRRPSTTRVLSYWPGGGLSSGGTCSGGTTYAGIGSAAFCASSCRCVSRSSISVSFCRLSGKHRSRR